MVLWRSRRLLVRLLLVAALPVTSLGLVLGHHVHASVRERAIEDGKRTAELVSRLGIQPQLRPVDLRGRIDPGRYAGLDRSVRMTGLLGREVARIKIWTTDGRVIYSDDAALVGRRYPISDELAEALDGEVASELSHLDKAEQAGERSYGEVVEVYVPLRFAADGAPVGAFELYLPYRPIEAAANADLHQIDLLLLAGLGLLALVLGSVALMIERLRRQSELNAHQATHDALTGLPNRTVYYDRLGQALLVAPRCTAPVTAVAIDLDGFKAVNDTLGHQAGDTLLAEVATRIRDQIRQVDTAARLGGDEFALLLPSAGAEEAADVAARIQAAFSEPFLIQGRAVRMSASMGIASFPAHATEPDTLLARADSAMYLAKRGGLGVATYVIPPDDQPAPTVPHMPANHPDRPVPAPPAGAS